MDYTIGEDSIPVMSSEELAGLSLAEVDDLRRKTPLVRTTGMRVTVFRSDDMEELSADPRLFQVHGPPFADAMGIPAGWCRSFLEGPMLMSDGRDHKRKWGPFPRRSHIRSNGANVIKFVRQPTGSWRTCRAANGGKPNHSDFVTIPVLATRDGSSIDPQSIKSITNPIIAETNA